jgi:bile acid-coenzyme A ligase
VSITYGARISELARTRGAEAAVTEVDARNVERSLSWQELDELSGRLAASLRHEGLAPGDLVAICLPNCLEHFVTDVAAWKIGAVPVALRWDLPEWELTRVLDVLGPAPFSGVNRATSWPERPPPPSPMTG